MIWQLEIILFVLLLVTAISALNAKNLLVGVVMLTLFSFIMALLFISMGAIDVGFTEAVVGAGVTGILFVVAIHKTTRATKD
jgi:multicomponent Na+:H+ antiporter subunit B